MQHKNGDGSIGRRHLNFECSRWANSQKTSTNAQGLINIGCGLVGSVPPSISVPLVLQYFTPDSVYAYAFQNGTMPMMDGPESSTIHSAEFPSRECPGYAVNPISTYCPVVMFTRYA